MSDPTRGTIRLVPVASFDVYDGETQIGRIHTDYRQYDETTAFQAIPWTGKQKSGTFPSIPEALAWLQERAAEVSA